MIISIEVHSFPFETTFPGVFLFFLFSFFALNLIVCMNTFGEKLRAFIFGTLIWTTFCGYAAKAMGVRALKSTLNSIKAVHTHSSHLLK